MLLETRSRGDSGSFAEKEGRRDPAQHRWPGGVPESEMDRATIAETRCVEAVVERPRPSDRRDITGKERIRAGHTHTRARTVPTNIQYYTNAYSTVIQYYNTSGPAIQIVTLNSQCADLKPSP